MNNQDAFVIVPVASGNSSSKRFDADAAILLKQFDKILREKLGLEIKIVQMDWFDYEKCQQLIISEGITSFMSMVSIREDIMHVTKYRGSIGDVLRKKLEDLSPSKEIIIVDGYIFVPQKDQELKDHLKFFTDIFSPTIRNIKHINFITHSKHYKETSYNFFKKSLKELNPELTVKCNTTECFHDRFWIIDRTKGLVIGASLNGIGNKYFLFDHLKDKDTKELLDILINKHLID